MPYYFVSRYLDSIGEREDSSSLVLAKSPKSLFGTTSVYIILGILSFLSGAFWYWSLPLTLLPVNSAVFQSQCIFMLVFGSLLLGEKITLPAMASMALSGGGIVLIACSSANKSAKNTRESAVGCES